MAVAHRCRGVKAWLLEWVPRNFDAKKIAGAGRDSASSEVAYILPPRLAWGAVHDVAKAIFFAARVEPVAMLTFRDQHWHEASPFMPRFPFAWEYRFPGDEHLHRGSYHEWFLLGGSPGLYARRVENLRAGKDGALRWTEHEAPPTRSWPDERKRS